MVGNGGTKSEGNNKWAVQGTYVNEYQSELRLSAREGLGSESEAFDNLLVSMLNVAFENGHVHPDNLSQIAGMLRDSHDIWLADRVPGSAWADVLFPDVGNPEATKPSFSRQLHFHSKGGLLLLSHVGTGEIFAQLGPDQRGTADFFDESTVQIELVVDLVTIVFAALGMPAKSSNLTLAFARYLFFNPRLKARLARLLNVLIHNRQRTFYEIAKDIADIFETLWRTGFFVEAGGDLVEGWDWFDWMVFVLGIVAMLTPAGGATTGAKLAYMAVQIGAMTAEITQKWVRFRDGEPLDQGPLAD